MKIIKGNSGKSIITRGLLLQVNGNGVLVLDELSVPHMFNCFRYCKSTDILKSLDMFSKLPSVFMDEVHHVVFLTKMVNMDIDIMNQLLELESETGKQFYLQINDFRMKHIKIYDMK